jgi:MoaA/NifB/PqqE/SkfB family radical SAM enzyme
MSCNLACEGCYAAGYPRSGEISLETIDRLLADAEDLGVFLVVVTGGEPLLREGLLEIVARHRRVLFLVVTNGTLIDRDVARCIAQARNIIPALSIEGPRQETDARRGPGVYDRVIGAMARLDRANCIFGFSVTVTRSNCELATSDDFVDHMISRGCALAFYTEYVPVGSEGRGDLVLDADQRAELRRRLLGLRDRKPIILTHLPDDEYDEDGRCRAVCRGCVHVNAQGFVEPCIFTHMAASNIGETPLAETLSSDFLRAIRSSRAVSRRGEIGCALIENIDEVRRIARCTGAWPTEASTRG